MWFFTFFSIILFSCISCFGQVQNESAEQVLRYWFGELHSAEDYPADRGALWFGGSALIDQDIRDRFEDLVLQAQNHELDQWKETPRGRLALIILVDQFPRNIYRGTPHAFAFDPKAQDLTLEGIVMGDDLALFPIERIFFYLPLEHAENLSLQELSIEKFNQIVEDAPVSLTEVCKSYASYAWRHYEIVEKFGRFPHRNTILNRDSTPEEIQFLQEPNSSF